MESRVVATAFLLLTLLFLSSWVTADAQTTQCPARRLPAILSASHHRPTKTKTNNSNAFLDCT